MTLVRRTALPLLLILTLVTCGCSGDSETGEVADTGRQGEGRGEHDRDGGEHGTEGEESGTELALDATYDRVRYGAHLILAYSADRNAFVGTVANTTNEVLERVRVEVHLSNGRELGPTEPADLTPGQTMNVELEADSTGFTGWTAHPEVGSGEHGHGEHDREGGEHGREGRGEHGREGGREHDREGRGEHEGHR